MVCYIKETHFFPRINLTEAFSIFSEWKQWKYYSNLWLCKSICNRNCSRLLDTSFFPRYSKSVIQSVSVGNYHDGLYISSYWTMSRLFSGTTTNQRFDCWYQHCLSVSFWEITSLINIFSFSIHIAKNLVLW